MDRTDEFFRAQEIVLLERLHAIDEHGLLVAESEDFMREVLLLREHATLNTYACIKITKKHDKQPHHTPPVQPAMIHHLSKECFGRSLGEHRGS